MQDATLPAALDRLSGLDRSIRLLDRHGEASLTRFAELRARALALLHAFQRRGVTPGDEMLLVVNRNDAFLDAYWACLYGGIVPVPLAPGVNDAQRGKILRIVGALRRPWLFTEHALAGRLAGFAREQDRAGAFGRLHGRTLHTEDISAGERAGQAAALSADATAFIQFSSGSTSDPKGVVLSHRNLLTNIHDMITTAGLESSDRGLSWMPLTHDMGLIGFHLMMLLAGMAHTIIATDAFIRRPMRWIRAASDYRASVLCSPNFGFRYLLKSFNPAQADDIDLGAVRIIFNGAEPISAALCDEFLDTLAPFGLRRRAMYPVYGLAEASLAVAFPRVGEGHRTLRVNRRRLASGQRVDLSGGDNPLTLVAVGRAIGACELRIGDQAGAELGADTVGRILIRGANVTGGFYCDGERLDRQAFRGDGWLDTGDLGFIHHDELYITGRTKDVIFVNGQNWYAHDIEAVAATAPGLELGKVVAAGTRHPQGDSDELALFIVFRGAPERFAATAHGAAARVNEQTGAQVAVAVAVRGIPKTTSGKLQRFALEEAYDRGELDGHTLRLASADDQRAAGPHEASPTENFLRQTCADVLDGVQVGRDDKLFEVGIGSLAMIEIHERIEARYPGRIAVMDLFDYPSIAALAARLDEAPRDA